MSNSTQAGEMSNSSQTREARSSQADRRVLPGPEVGSPTSGQTSIARSPVPAMGQE